MIITKSAQEPLSYRILHHALGTAADAPLAA
jgi:hypothetical protein